MASSHHGRRLQSDALTFATFAVLLVTPSDAQTFANGPTQGVCNATVALQHCSLDPTVADAVRQTWPPGLVSDISKPLYGQPSEYTMFADEIAALIHQLFRDADRKETHIYDAGGSPGECYFPLLYYVCSSAYHECVEDRNVSVRVEREVEGSTNGLVVTEVVVEKFKVPRYPCVGFCEDAQVRGCKDTLIEAMEETLVGLPTLPHYIANVTDWFNCTKVGESSAYAKFNSNEVCLSRPVAPAPPPQPPAIPPPAAPPPPPAVSGARRFSYFESLRFVNFLVLATVVVEMLMRGGFVGYIEYRGVCVAKKSR